MVSFYFCFYRFRCRRDSTVYIYTNGNRFFAQFSFRAFKFLRTHNQVFVRCDVVICADNDYNSRCRQGCRSNRRKRSLSSDHHTEVVTLGPITLKGQRSPYEFLLFRWQSRDWERFFLSKAGLLWTQNIFLCTYRSRGSCGQDRGCGVNSQ